MDYDTNNNLQGNLSTIVLFIYIILAPYLESLGITQSLFAEFVFALIGLIIAIWSAYNPNTLKIFGNDKQNECSCNCGVEETVLNDEYELETDDEGC